jgi:GNAT superfamily N-acetyltransferase
MIAPGRVVMQESRSWIVLFALPILNFLLSVSTPHPDAFMIVVLREESMGMLVEHAAIPVSFTAECVLDMPRPGERPLWPFGTRPLPAPYVKDYDSIPGNRPTDWAARFDLSRWRLIGAYAGDRRTGGAVVVLATVGIDPSAARGEDALLWDIRVVPAARRTGIGSRLLRAAEEMAAGGGCRRLLVETQNINVAACRFYANQGYVVDTVDRGAYRGIPHETRVVWRRELAPGMERP